MREVSILFQYTTLDTSIMTQGGKQDLQHGIEESLLQAIVGARHCLDSPDSQGRSTFENFPHPGLLIGVVTNAVVLVALRLAVSPG